MCIMVAHPVRRVPWWVISTFCGCVPHPITLSNRGDNTRNARNTSVHLHCSHVNPFVICHPPALCLTLRLPPGQCSLKQGSTLSFLHAISEFKSLLLMIWSFEISGNISMSIWSIFPQWGSILDSKWDRSNYLMFNPCLVCFVFIITFRVLN